MVICLTILSLQQLLDAGQYRYRFGVLRKLGVEEQDIKSLVRKQLSVWFGLPVVVSIIVLLLLWSTSCNPFPLKFPLISELKL